MVELIHTDVGPTIGATVGKALMVNNIVAVSLQPELLVTIYFIVVVPAFVPVVNNPFWLIVPTEEILLLLQIPPGVALLNCNVRPRHTLLPLVIGECVGG